MISTLTGTVTSIGLDNLVLDIGGVGFSVRTTPGTLASARHGNTLTLHTELVVREDSLTLFGFATPDEVDVFRTVQSVSGIGPRIALAALAVLGPDGIRRAVATEDVKAISRTPGIGPKVASRMILELRGKLPVLSDPEESVEASANVDAAADANQGRIDDVVLALVGLGWPDAAASKAVDKARAKLRDIDPSAKPSNATVLRESLRELGGRR
ncbi:Holliday junction branch migration protein RuvA [Devriesea agamarum]|uniref:Holliday junction branch migration protein RuvA n=1 Tax=Devriesea agamarum TaxID=472569 RepID=UPI00071DD31E|nr:Holliday junction branch migration protein RuvA [Devriesea agamarum]